MHEVGLVVNASKNSVKNVNRSKEIPAFWPHLRGEQNRTHQPHFLLLHGMLKV